MQIVCGVPALAVALSPPKGPVRLRALIDRLGGKPGERPVVGDPPARDRLERRTVEQKELAVRGLTVRFGRGTAAGQLDLVAQARHITRLVGATGARETTTYTACS